MIVQAYNYNRLSLISTDYNNPPIALKGSVGSFSTLCRYLFNALSDTSPGKVEAGLSSTPSSRTAGASALRRKSRGSRCAALPGTPSGR